MYPRATCVITTVGVVLITILVYTVTLYAEVIHSVAFEDDLHALHLHTAEDGHAVLNEIPYLQVSCLLCCRCRHSQAQHFLYVIATLLCIEEHMYHLTLSMNIFFVFPAKCP